MNLRSRIRLALATFIFWSYCNGGMAQQVTVRVTDTTHVQDSLGQLDHHREKLLQRKAQLEQKREQLENNSFKIPGTPAVPDSLQSTVNSLNTFSKRTIYSEKHLNAIRDSIERKIGMPLPQHVDPKKEMLDLINAKYPDHPRAPSSKGEIMNAGKDSLQTSAGLPEDLPGLKNFALDPAPLQELTPLPGNVVKPFLVQVFLRSAWFKSLPGMCGWRDLDLSCNQFSN